MTTKQHAPRLLPISCLTGCALLGVASSMLYPGAGNAVLSAHQQVPGAALARKNTSSGKVWPEAAETRQHLAAAYGRVPLSFEVNQGQTDPQVKYLARGGGYTLFLTSSEAVLSLSGGRELLPKHAGHHRLAKLAEPWALSSGPSISSTVLRMQMAGANLNPQVAASEVQPGTSNYFLGSDPRNWRTSVPHYARIKYQAVYSGVDLVFHGEQRQLEFDFIVSPGSDPTPIKLRFTGANRIVTDNFGNLVLTSSVGDLTLHKPIAYQEERGLRCPVDARFVVKDGNQVGFAIGNYDHRRELVIDPTLLYSTYLGGGGEDVGFGIAVDNRGNAYVTGTTNSTRFPGASGSPAGGFDVFVTKLNAGGSAILYSTFLGGSGDELGTVIETGPSIAVDSAFNAYIAGSTSSADFPVTTGAAQSQFGGGQDGFVAKLNSTGSTLTYATYIGGSGIDSSNAIAIDGSGNAYISGGAQSTDFPVTPGALKTTSMDGQDGFVAKLNPTGTVFVYSTYLGGSSFDTAHAIALGTGMCFQL